MFLYHSILLGNSNSSSFLFIEFHVEGHGKITILDMAGNEDVDTIQKLYFENVQTNYNTEAFNSSIVTNLEKIPLTINKTTSKIGTLSGVPSTININDFIEKFIDISPITPVGNKQGMFIKKDPWIQLAKTLKDDKMEVFAKNFNLYNYIELIRPFYALKISFIYFFNPLFVFFPEKTTK